MCGNKPTPSPQTRPEFELLISVHFQIFLTVMQSHGLWIPAVWLPKYWTLALDLAQNQSISFVRLRSWVVVETPESSGKLTHRNHMLPFRKHSSTHFEENVLEESVWFLAGAALAAEVQWQRGEALDLVERPLARTIVQMESQVKVMCQGWRQNSVGKALRLRAQGPRFGPQATAGHSVCAPL